MSFKQALRHLLYWMFASLTLSACGGSGSSGFDASSATSISFDTEQSVILQVSGEGGCLETEGATICASLDALEAGADTPATTTPPTNRSAVLSITPSSGSSAACAQVLGQPRCHLKTLVQVSGFPVETQFVVATRLAPSASWVIGPELSQIASTSPSSLDATVQFEVSEIEASPNLQIAVLVVTIQRFPG